MRIFKTVLYFFLGLALMSSCSLIKKITGPSNNEKLIVGSWKGDKLLSFSPASPASQDYLNATNPQEEPAAFMTEDSITKRTTKRAQVHLQSVEEAARAGNLSTFYAFLPDFKSSMEFKSDKTALLTSQKNTISGTWKMNAKGTKVTIICNEKKSKIILDLNKIDSLSMEAADYFPEGKILMLYKKR